MNEIRNATCEQLYLGGWDRSVPEPGEGLLTAWLPLKWDMGGVSFGGYNLGGVFTDHFIRKLLHTLECSEVAKLAGTKCRVRLEGNVCTAIGHWDKERWMTKQDLEEWAKENCQ